MTAVQEKLNEICGEGWNYEKQIIEVAVLPHLEEKSGEEVKLLIMIDAFFFIIKTADMAEILFHERFQDEDECIAEAKALRNLLEKLDNCKIEDAEYPNEYFVTFNA